MNNSKEQNNGAARVDRAVCGRSEDLARCVGESDEPQTRQNAEGHREPLRAGSTPARSAKKTRARSPEARDSTIKTCADRATVLLRLKEWLIAYKGTGPTAKEERALVAAATRYFKVKS